MFGSMTLGKIINYSDNANYPLWVNVLLSIASGVIYLVLAIIIDQCGKWLHHPTTSKLLSQKDDKPLEDH